jgi:hypothetical protein
MSCLLDLLGKVHPGVEFKEFPFQFFCEKQDAEELNLADDFLGKLPTIDMIKAYEAQVIWLPKLYRHHLERGGMPPEYGPIRHELPRRYLKVGMWWEADQAVVFFSKYKFHKCRRLCSIDFASLPKSPEAFFLPIVSVRFGGGFGNCFPDSPGNCLRPLWAGCIP